MRNVSFNLRLVRLALTVAFVATCSFPPFSHAATNLVEEVAIPDEGPVKLVTQAAEQNKDQAIMEVVELVEDKFFPGRFERRVGNRSYWFGNIEIEPIMFMEQPVFGLFMLAFLAMFSPKSIRVEAGRSNSGLRKLIGLTRKTIFDKSQRLKKVIPFELELSSLRSLILRFFFYACAFCFLWGLGSQMYTPCLWLVGGMISSALVNHYATCGISIDSLIWKILRKLFGIFLLVIGEGFLALTLIVLREWATIDPLVLATSLAFSSMAIVVALRLLHFRFCVIKRIASIKSVSALGAVLVLVSFASGLFYGDNKIITYVDPWQELHTFW